MSRPFVLLYTRCSGADPLVRLLDSHPFVNIRNPQFDKERPQGVAVRPEPKRIEILQRIWAPYERPIRRALGVALRIEHGTGHVTPDSEMLDAIRGFDPAVLVLRDDNMLMQAVERLAEAAGGPVEVTAETLGQSLETVRRDYRLLDQVAERMGPVMEIARDEIEDGADMLMQSVARLLVLPDATPETPEDGPGALPRLEDLATNPDTVRALAEETEFAGMV